MPCFYHATSWRNAESIDSNGFVIGWGGLAGPGVYVCETEDQACRRCRGPADVVFQVRTWYWPDAAPVPGNYIIYNPSHEIQSYRWYWDCQHGYS
ncbi:unnamed protein product [Amoebophrya sp. A120]|nr:unnamed protein product [Amoebophrya sp. A120]|eukprot:GSA120T00025549001.1